jgi:hypothetical protein
MHVIALQRIGFARLIRLSTRQALSSVFCLGSSNFDTLQSATLAFKTNYKRLFERLKRTIN